MNKDNVRATLLSLSEEELQHSKEGYATFLKSAMIDRTEPTRRDDASMAEAAGEIAEAFDKPVHSSALKIEKVRAIDFGPKNRVEEGAIVKLSGHFLVVSVPTSRFECDGESFIGISTDAPLYLGMEGLRVGDKFTFGGHHYTIEQLD